MLNFLENWFQIMLSVLRVILSINSPKQFLNSDAHPLKKKIIWNYLFASIKALKMIYFILKALVVLMIFRCLYFLVKFTFSIAARTKSRILC